MTRADANRAAMRVEPYAACGAAETQRHQRVDGAAHALHDVPLGPALIAWGHGTAANLVSASVRLVPLGQTDGQRATAALMPVVEATAARAQATDLDDLGTASPLLELASLAHETQYSRLFRS